MDAEYKHSDVTDLIIKAFYTVYNTLGYGFLEKVCVNAMVIELGKLGLLLNFGPKPEIKRKVFDNARKPNLKSST